MQLMQCFHSLCLRTTRVSFRTHYTTRVAVSLNCISSIATGLRILQHTVTHTGTSKLGQHSYAVHKHYTCTSKLYPALHYSNPATKNSTESLYSIHIHIHIHKTGCTFCMDEETSVKGPTISAFLSMHEEWSYLVSLVVEEVF